MVSLEQGDQVDVAAIQTGGVASKAIFSGVGAFERIENAKAVLKCDLSSSSHPENAFTGRVLLPGTVLSPVLFPTCTLTQIFQLEDRVFVTAIPSPTQGECDWAAVSVDLEVRSLCEAKKRTTGEEKDHVVFGIVTSDNTIWSPQAPKEKNPITFRPDSIKPRLVVGERVRAVWNPAESFAVMSGRHDFVLGAPAPGSSGQGSVSGSQRGQSVVSSEHEELVFGDSDDEFLDYHAARPVGLPTDGCPKVSDGVASREMVSASTQTDRTAETCLVEKFLSDPDILSKLTVKFPALTCEVIASINRRKV